MSSVPNPRLLRTVPERQPRPFDPQLHFCSRTGAQRSVKRKTDRSRPQQEFSITQALLCPQRFPQKPARTFPILLNHHRVRSDTNHVGAAFHQPSDAIWTGLPNPQAHARHIAAPAAVDIWDSSHPSRIVGTCRRRNHDPIPSAERIGSRHTGLRGPRAFLSLLDSPSQDTSLTWSVAEPCCLS